MEPTEFTKKIISILGKIPRGKVVSYSQIAALAGKPHAARGVSYILHSSSKKHKLPWQRVINSKGKISFPKKSPYYRKQKLLLTKEKVKFAQDDSINLKIYGWKKKAKRPRNTPHMFS